MEEYKVLITTGGIGSRLGDLTTYKNKALVRVGKKAAISHIVESYPENIEMVVTVDYHGELVKDFLQLVYPKRKFTFIDTKGSPSVGCSILMAKEELQCPFIFHACDTIIKDQQNIPTPYCNWIGGHISSNSSHYRSFNVSNDRVLKMNEKGEKDYDYIHIGLCGFKDYELFWSILEKLYGGNKTNKELSDCHVISEMLEETLVKYIEFSTWFDIGNIDGLRIAKEVIEEDINVIEKQAEEIYMTESSVIKFFYDKDIVDKRVKRTKLLNGLVPKVTGVKGNFYKYDFIEGEELSKKITVDILKDLISWMSNNLWHQLGDSTGETFDRFYNFYFVKTRNRMLEFLSNNNIKDTPVVINGIKCSSVAVLLDKIDLQLLCSEVPYRFHGDFILDNIIYTLDEEFCLIDWRQDFEGVLDYGDVYYDLAKLNHSFIFNHELINKGYFSINIDSEIQFELFEKYTLSICQKAFYSTIKELGFNCNKVAIITSLIWLNMAALHPRPINLFLWYFGQYNLTLALQGSLI